MTVNIFILICSLCVVKAYVAVNVFNDGFETQKSSLSMGLENSPKISDCSPLGCAQLCRRIGLKGGVCVNGKCKCDLFTDFEGADIATTPNIDLENSPSISECSPLGCAQLCRRIGLKGGVCVHGKCKCDLFIDLEGDTQKPLTMCDWSRCDRGCRSIGYPGGNCVSSECRCNPRPFEAEHSNRIESMDDEVRVLALENPSPMISDCNPLACEQLCRGVFLKGGVCVHGRCECDIISDSEGTETNEIPAVKSENKDKVESEKSSVGICIASECSIMCRRIGFTNGTCDVFKDACKCY